MKAIILFAEALFILCPSPFSLLHGQTVDSIALFKTNAGCPKWSPNNQKIGYHTIESDNNYDIHVMDANQQNDVCLTCNHPNLPNGHQGNLNWHPSGNWMVFIAEKSNYYLYNLYHPLAKPGIGWNCDVYMISTVTNAVFQITNLPTKMGPFDPTPISGVLGPHFSPDGTKISWGEKIDTGGVHDWGEYVIRIADFSIISNTPVVSNIQTLQPATGKYLETNSFSSDSKTLYFCGNLKPGQTEYGIDLFSYDLITQQIDTITNTYDYFDECAHISPSDNRIAYLSTEGFPNDTINNSWWQWAKGEFWLINPDGSNKQQITHFNFIGYPEYTGNRIIPAMIDWNQNETVLLAGIAEETTPGVMEDKIYKIHLSNSQTNISPIYNEMGSGIAVLPTISGGIFNLEISQFENLKMKSIEIYNVFWEKIYISVNFQINQPSNLQVDLSDHPSGIYMVQVRSNGFVQTERVAVIK